MDLERMIEKENTNRNRIFLYMADDGFCLTYEFSAYLLTRLFDTLKLEEEKFPQAGAILYVARVSAGLVVEQFSGTETTVGNNYIKVILDNEPRCAQWRKEFDELKIQQQIDNNKLGEAILGFFRLSE